MRLAGKVAVITGAGSGIGRAAALLFAAEGAAVVAGVYEPDGPEPLPSSIVAVPCDVTRDEDVARLFGAAIDRHGGLDILINNAGIESPGTVTETTDEQWQRLIDVNLKGQFLCARHAVPLMLARGRGAIVNNASINGIRGNHRLVAYSASKGGVVAMTMAMALDYAPRGIRVNCVCPAAIENTRMDAISAARAPDPQQRLEYLLAKHPIGRLGQPQEVAYAMLFLASDESSFITGVALPVDGGRSIR
jgi:NAD(P)-dependent dehydrogenase (short-subunit alcohol dehydrogenase family)